MATTPGPGFIVVFYRNHQRYEHQLTTEAEALAFIAAGERAKQLVGWELTRPDGTSLDVYDLDRLYTPVP